MSAEGYHRKKQPQAVRTALLAAAGRLAVDHGLQAVTIQAVADAAGVTKGGLLHHFASKEALLFALFQDYVDQMAADLDRLMAADTDGYGRFTRAYIRSALTSGGDGVHDPATVLALMAEPQLRRLWYDWLAAQEALHVETDADPQLRIARLAADGLWLAATDRAPDADWHRALQDLLRMAGARD